MSVAVHDTLENPIAGVTVTGSWSGGASGSGSCVTGADGRCPVNKGNLKSSIVQVDFSVTGISGTGLSYAGSANHDPDGNSDGTTISVSRP